MTKISYQNFSMNYEMYGSGEETLVMISGLRADHNGWQPVIKPLSKKYKLLVFDNRGAGLTDSPDCEYTVNQMANDTINLIRNLGVEKPHIVGHSLGGAIAQNIAYKYNNEIKSLVLCNTFSKFSVKSCAVFEKALRLYKNNSKPSVIVGVFLDKVFSKEFLSTEGMSDTILGECDKVPNPQNYFGYKGQVHALSKFDSKLWLNKVKNPTFIVHGKDDSIVSLTDAQELKDNIKLSSLEVVPGGHVSQVEQPELISKIIKDFI